MKNSGLNFFIFILTTFLLASSCIPSLGQTPQLHGGAMLDCSGLPCVDVTLASGKHLRMLVDTGDANSVLDEAVAKEMGLSVEPVTGRDGKPVAGYGRAVLQGVAIGDASLGDIRVLVSDIGKYIKKDVMPASQGALAYTAFKGRILSLDYKRHTVRFSESLSQDVPCPGTCGEVTTPTFGQHGPPIVVATGFAVNGKPITAQIDTLFSGTMLIYPTSVTKLGLDQESKSAQKKFFRYTDGGVDMLEGVAQTESFGNNILGERAPIYFATPQVHQPDGMFDGTVGHELFKNLVLTLDLHANRVWLSN